MDSQQHQYGLVLPGDNRNTLALAWLSLGLFALLLSGIFSLLLVVARTPYLQAILPWPNFFHSALVVHVDLSVLVWFLAFCGMLWTINSTKHLISLGWVAYVLALSGTIIIIASPFSDSAQPLMSNYIPVIQNSIFLVGIFIFATGIGLLLLRSMTAIPLVGPWMSGTASIRFGLNAMTISAAMALIAFTWSYFSLPEYLTGKGYFELLFWGGGHVLQFTYTLLMLVAWLCLASAAEMKMPISPRVVLVFFWLGLFAVFISPIIYYSYPVSSPEHIQLFTWLMRYGGSLATLPLSLAILYGLIATQIKNYHHAHLRASLIMSMILFGFGGIIGFMITTSNVTIPAHYHGSIVGVTLALMGMTYLLLPQFGIHIAHTSLAKKQAYIYGIGQMLHVIGLMWSGGYGVQRKVAGAEQGLDRVEQIMAMGLMGLGGLVAIVGGLLFLYIVLPPLFSNQFRNV